VITYPAKRKKLFTLKTQKRRKLTYDRHQPFIREEIERLTDTRRSSKKLYMWHIEIFIAEKMNAWHALTIHTKKNNLSHD
jgi:hypothetical protein